MKKLASAAALAVAIAATGCYHATIDTGLQPSGQTIKKPWATSFVYGLVPPEVVETAAKCPNGVAKVETQLSFLNQLVSALTFGIFTPMTIEVQCAAPRTGMAPSDATVKVGAAATTEQKTVAMQQAVETAKQSGSAFVVFE